VPVRDAEVHLRWLDETGVWHDTPTLARTTVKGGDFAAFVRFAPDEVGLLDSDAPLTVRLRARRGASERESADFHLPQGRIADPSTFSHGRDALIFAWDELQP
jgi:hypothetical protein